MKIFVVVTCALLALASADVSHLSKKYLPPAQQSYSNAGFSYSTPLVQQSYSPPLVQQPTYSVPAVQQSYAAPVNEYLPPNKHSYSTGGSSGLGGLGGLGGFSGSFGYSAPAVDTTYNAPSVSYQLPAVQQDYLPPVQQTYVPAVQGTYSAPTSGYSGSSFSYSSGDAGTQYASNGGYVYKK
ncbi:uncharacterized protein LOC119642199 [Glossina fuscipes]|uniref:Uncharacterized protein LOC119642199 n=1 Tax=Glossina fuscipes TaxID=7396 RepID=A0A9C5ZIE8_9MUSC|nr:uncharacterized protein LOC119642199 [Glossina fuscipes]KAI9589331.1 hypothetical protein GQX74_007500 [Glossina fuscipes]